MWDESNNYNEYHIGPSRIDVHEHRAPTADSIRLAMEMQDKIKSQVVSSGTLQGNLLHGKWMAFQDPCIDSLTVVGQMKLNERFYEFTVSIPSYRFMEKQEIGKVIIDGFHKELAKHLAQEMLEQNREVFNRLKTR